jgi:hypothetical protein
MAEFMQLFFFFLLTFLTTTFLVIKLHGYVIKNNFFAHGKLNSISMLFNVSLVVIWLASAAVMVFPTAYGSGVIFFFFFKICTDCKSATPILATVVPGFLWGVLSLPAVIIFRSIVLRFDKRLSCDRNRVTVNFDAI